MLAANVYAVWEALVILVGLIGIATVAGVVVFALVRENNGRPLFPWGARMRVEREKARLEMDALEIKRIALGHQRDLVLDAIKEGDNEEVMRLGLPSPQVSTPGNRYRAVPYDE